MDGSQKRMYSVLGDFMVVTRPDATSKFQTVKNEGAFALVQKL
jgi:hypothetical protein